MAAEIMTILGVLAQAAEPVGNIAHLDGEQLHMGVRTFIVVCVEIATVVAVIVSLVTTVKYIKVQLDRIETQGREASTELVGWIRRVEHETREEIKEMDTRIDGIDKRTTVIETVCNLQHGPGVLARTSTGPVEAGKSAQPVTDVEAGNPVPPSDPMPEGSGAG